MFGIAELAGGLSAASIDGQGARAGLTSCAGGASYGLAPAATVSRNVVLASLEQSAIAGLAVHASTASDSYSRRRMHGSATNSSLKSHDSHHSISIPNIHPASGGWRPPIGAYGPEDEPRARRLIAGRQTVGEGEQKPAYISTPTGNAFAAGDPPDGGSYAWLWAHPPGMTAPSGSGDSGPVSAAAGRQPPAPEGG